MPKRLGYLKNVEKDIIKFIVVPLMAIIGLFLFNKQEKNDVRTSATYNYVKRVVDGDTVVLSNNERVRYIGINTPELHHPTKGIEYYGKEARDANSKLVLNKKIRLEFDIEKRDKYGRLLAYVFDGETFVNAELVKNGYARVYTFRPNVKYYDLLHALEKEAKKNGKGIWGPKKNSI